MTKKAKQHVGIKRPALRLALLGLILLVSGSLLVILWLHLSVKNDLPAVAALSDIRHMQSSEVYSADERLIGKYYLHDRTPVEYSDIPLSAVRALVATEDIRYYQHSGIDWRSMPRVFFKSILLGDESAGGGSTITQQLAKNLFPRKPYRQFALLKNKYREMLMARELEDLYTKEEILTLYFNTVPFGMNAFGIQSSSQRYYRKNCDLLEVHEAAALVGMLKATTYYSPVKYPDRSLSRRNIVLHQMRQADFLTDGQYDSLSLLPLGIHAGSTAQEADLAPYFRDRLRQEILVLLDSLPAPGQKPYNLYTDGLTIRTTLDSRMQHYAESAVGTHIARLQKQFEEQWKGSTPPWHDPAIVQKELQKAGYSAQSNGQNTDPGGTPQGIESKRDMSVFSWDGQITRRMSTLDSIRYFLKFLHAGFVALDPETGAVKAWVGGIDFGTFPYDHVHTEAKRQVGSVFKPIVYAAALEQGLSPCQYIRAGQQTFNEKGEAWRPSNVDDNYEGKYSMEGGLMHSVNTVSVKILEETGVEHCISLAGKMGIESDIPPYPSIALGTPSISLLEMVGAYAGFANGGIHHTPYTITSIEDKEGRIIWEHPALQPTRAMREETAIQIREMLRAVVNSGTAASLRTEYGLAADLAGKTGTTQNNADGWFIATIPGLAVGAWVGAAYPSIHFRSTALGQGAKTALPVVGMFFDRLSTDPHFDRLSRERFPRTPDHLMVELDCEPFREDFKFFEWLFGKKNREKPDDRKKKDKPGLMKKIGNLFKKKGERQ